MKNLLIKIFLSFFLPLLLILIVVVLNYGMVTVLSLIFNVEKIEIVYTPYFFLFIIQGIAVLYCVVNIIQEIWEE